LNDNSALLLRDIWNRLLLSKSIYVCTGKLKGVSILEIKVLKLVYFHPEYKIKDFLDALGIPNSTFTNAVNRLVKRELIIRKIDQSDLRSFKLELTTVGKDAIEEHLDAETIIFEDILSRLDFEERNEFVTLMNKIVSGQK
jgi:DNA-binding MarR family transcriptional regulator